MKAAVYIESSVISYYTSRPSRDIVVAGRQAVTREWWALGQSKFDLFVSVVVHDEVSGGDEGAATERLRAIAGLPALALTRPAQDLADLLLKRGCVPRGSEEDALHIAIAAVHGMDFLLTWNFKHINNAETKALIAREVEAVGYVCPILCSPEELGVE